MSVSPESFFGDQPITKASIIDPMVPEDEKEQNSNCNDVKEDLNSEDGKEELDHLNLMVEPKKYSDTNSECGSIDSKYSNQEYADMKGDPSMRYEYSSGRPAAGYPTKHGPYNMDPTPTGRRHYKTADDTFDMGTYKPNAADPSHHVKSGENSYTNSEYANMKGDPSMRYEYSIGRPAAGYSSSRKNYYNTQPESTANHQDETADDGEENEEMENSGASSPEPGSQEHRHRSDDPNPSINIEHSNPEEISYTNSEYADMKGDPSMSYEYSSGRPAAGCRTPRLSYNEENDNDSEKKEDDEPEGISYTNSQYADMKGDPAMRYEYSSGRPAAGCRTPRSSTPSF